jgi:DNA replication and repair protein RecF
MTDQKKKLRLNEILQAKIGNLMGNLLVVLFSPESLSLIKDGPSERRRFMDISLSQIKPMYFHYLQDYNKILKNRNKLLKDQNDIHKLKNVIGIWNEQLADYGSKITCHRNEFLSKIEEYAKIKHRTISGGREEIKIKYKSSVPSDSFDNWDNLKKIYVNRLESSLKNDMIRCSTSYGPHRDDFEIFINDKNTKQFASQGQQRSATLALKLAELEIMKNETNSYPVLLLDDVMSELDKNRREFLLDQMDKIQTFITVTDKDMFEEQKLHEVSFIKVEQGNVLV